MSLATGRPDTRPPEPWRRRDCPPSSDPRGAKKNLIATLAISKNHSTLSQQTTSRISNRNKNAVFASRTTLRDAVSLAASLVTANRKWCRIEIAVTYSKQSAASLSNRNSKGGIWHSSRAQTRVSVLPTAQGRSRTASTVFPRPRFGRRPCPATGTPTDERACRPVRGGELRA